VIDNMKYCIQFSIYEDTVKDIVRDTVKKYIVKKFDRDDCYIDTVDELEDIFDESTGEYKTRKTGRRKIEGIFRVDDEDTVKKLIQYLRENDVKGTIVVHKCYHDEYPPRRCTDFRRIDL